jgi:capsular exopolysaccharide synthesis family protein
MRQRFKIKDVHTPESLSNQAVPVYLAPIPDQEEVESGGATVPLAHYLWIIRQHLWKILAFVAACVLVTFIMSARLKPIYESTATIDVDLQAPTQVVGDNNAAQSYAQLDSDQFLATQIKLIQSDAVLRPVAEQFHFLGQDSQAQGKDPAKAQQAVAAPVSLGGLSVTRPPSTYLLQISYRSPNAGLAADVANAVANSYLAYTYNLRIRSSLGLSDFMGKQLDELKAKMEQSSLALAQYQKELDVINPDEKTNILSARLQQLNTEYTTAQADRIRAEAAWNALKSGSIEAAQATSGGNAHSPLQGNSLSSLTEALNRAQQRFALVKSTYGSNHPEYRKAASELVEVQTELSAARQDVTASIEAQARESRGREQLLQAAVMETKAEWDNINAKSFHYQRLKQEADTDRALYNELTKKIREGDINSGFRNNNIRIADFARPSPAPVYPNKQRNVEMALVFSLLLAIGTAILLDSLDNTLRNPKEASRFLGTDVIATMPADRDAAQLPRPAKSPAAPFVVSTSVESGNQNGYYGASSSFEEAIRTLRNTILLSDVEGMLHSIVLTSAVPGEGKTTLAAHLGIANAGRGKKTLLVDGDLRRPSLSSKFGLTPREGLSNVLNGEMRWQDVVLPIADKPNLGLLPAGVGSHRASDLIGPRVATLLDEFAKEYDLVILDAPPLLGFAECLQMASAADGVLVTTIAGKTKRGAVADVISALHRVHANIVGVVLNQVSRNTFGDGYSYYKHYSYIGYQDPQQPQAESQS